MSREQEFSGSITCLESLSIQRDEISHAWGFNNVMWIEWSKGSFKSSMRWENLKEKKDKTAQLCSSEKDCKQLKLCQIRKELLRINWEMQRDRSNSEKGEVKVKTQDYVQPEPCSVVPCKTTTKGSSVLEW